MDRTPDLAALWESLTPAQRDMLAVLDHRAAFVRVESRAAVYGLRLAGLVEEDDARNEFWRRTQRGRSLAAYAASLGAGHG